MILPPNALLLRYNGHEPDSRRAHLEPNAHPAGYAPWTPGEIRPVWEWDREYLQCGNFAYWQEFEVVLDLDGSLPPDAPDWRAARKTFLSKQRRKR